MEYSSKEKIELIEEIGVLFEQTHDDLTPLASRINVMMILSPSDGHTFEEIVTMTKASKSSVSNQLKLLLQLKRVEYFTKTGERKRYFRASREYLKLRLEDHMDKITKEIELIQSLNKFNKKNNPEKFEKYEPLSRLFKNYLLAQEENLKTTIDKMCQLNKSQKIE